jgi:hypothetical protein
VYTMISRTHLQKKKEKKNLFFTEFFSSQKFLIL